MRLMAQFVGSSRRILSISVLLCILTLGCAPSRKTGTVVTEGTVTGVEMNEGGQLGRTVVKLAVKLDGGSEVEATWMEEQGKTQGYKGRRVEVEPSKDSKLWRVTRMLDTDNSGNEKQ